MLMDLEFVDDDTRLLCEKGKVAVKRLGAVSAKKLASRLADLSAATTVRDLCVGHPHALKGDRKGQFAVRLHGGLRLVFVPTSEEPPLTKDGDIAWNDIDCVRIIYIGDYHE